jgi:multiple sugar transport system permease protein
MQARSQEKVRGPNVPQGTPPPVLSQGLAARLQRSINRRLHAWQQNSAKAALILPAVLLVLFLSIFPLVVSLYLSMSQVAFVKRSFEIKFVGFANYQSLLTGLYQREFLGRMEPLGIVQWIVLGLFTAFMIYMMYLYLTSRRRTVFGFVMRVISIIFAAALAWLVLSTLTGEGLPGTLVVTMIFAFGGVFFQYVIGLGLALLVTQELPGKRFFRVVFLLPMMITPVGIGFLFRMMTDTLVGPIAPLWNAMGLTDFSWSNSGFGARTAVMIGDVWQWTPFMFIILLAALEGISREQIEAALVDGANRVEMFRFIVIPSIIPVSTTLILIRLIEAFKIIDMPNILTGGGPGTATESVTLHSYNLWRTTDLGTSAALAYLLLVVVTFIATIYVNTIRRRLVAEQTR